MSRVPIYTNLVAPIKPGGDTVNFSAGRANDFRGGYHIVETNVERDAILAYDATVESRWPGYGNIRTEGMLCYVVSTGKTYRLVGGISNAHWVDIEGLIAQHTHSKLHNPNAVPADDPILYVDASNNVFANNYHVATRIANPIDGYHAVWDDTNKILDFVQGYAHPTGFSNVPATALSGNHVISQITVNSEGHVTGVSTRELAYDNYNKWVLKANTEATGVDVLTGEDVVIKAGTNITVARSGRQITISSSVEIPEPQLYDHALTDHTDVVIATPQTNQLLAFNGTNWVNWTPNFSYTLEDHDIITKHTASGLTSGHVLKATGATTFAFAALIASDIPALPYLPDDTVIPVPATVAPLAHGTAAVGTSLKYAREDHVHPESGTSYIHPDKTWINKTNLSGAVVISNLTIDALGHPTNWTTRSLAPSDIGAALADHSHGYDLYGSWNLNIGTTTHQQVASGGTVKFLAGNNISLSYANDAFTISSSAAGANYYLTNLAFDANTGELTATVSGTNNVLVSLDGRYSLSTHSHSYHWSLGANGDQTIDITHNDTVRFYNDSILTISRDTRNITISHKATSGYKHIPAGGAAGNILTWLSDGTAQWSTTSSAYEWVLMYNNDISTKNYILGAEIVNIYNRRGVQLVYDYEFVTIPSGYLLELTGQALAFHELSTSGIVTKIGTADIVSREIEKSGNGISITNGNGIAGNPTISLDIGTGSTQIASGNHTHTQYASLGTNTINRSNGSGGWEDTGLKIDNVAKTRIKGATSFSAITFDNNMLIEAYDNIYLSAYLVESHSLYYTIKTDDPRLRTYNNGTFTPTHDDHIVHKGYVDNLGFTLDIKQDAVSIEGASTSITSKDTLIFDSKGLFKNMISYVGDVHTIEQGLWITGEKKLVGSIAGANGLNLASEITLGTGLTMTGSELSASGGASLPAGTTGQVLYYNNGWVATSTVMLDLDSFYIGAINGTGSFKLSISSGRLNIYKYINGSYTLVTWIDESQISATNFKLGV